MSLVRPAPHAHRQPPFTPLAPVSVQLHPCFASSLRMAQKQGLEELIGRAQELPLPPPPPLLPPSVGITVAVPEPAASVLGGAAAEVESPIVDSEPGPAQLLAVAAEIAAQAIGKPEAEAVVAAGDDGSSDADRAVSACLQDSLAYLLARQDVAAALRGGSPPPPALGPAGGSHPGGQGQWQQPHPLPACRPGGAPAAAAPSSSSLAPASSLDTASSLRESQRRAAVEQVVQQIEANSNRRAPHRLSRKQRQKRRRQRLQRQKDTAPAGEPAALALAAAAATQPGAARQGSVSPRPRPGADGEDEGFASPATAPPASTPPHWQHAMRELDAAFQPRLRLRKRLRLVVGAVG